MAPCHEDIGERLWRRLPPTLNPRCAGDGSLFDTISHPIFLTTETAEQRFATSRAHTHTHTKLSYDSILLVGRRHGKHDWGGNIGLDPF